MTGGIAVIGRISLDLLFGGIPRLPGIGEEIYSESFDLQLGCSSFVYATVLKRLGVPVKLGTFLSAGMRSQMAKMLLDKELLNTYINLYPTPEQNSPDPIMISAAMSTVHDRSFMSYADNYADKLVDDETIYRFYHGAKIAPTIHGYPEVMQQIAKEGTVLVHDTWWHDDMSLEREAAMLSIASVFSPNDKEALFLTKTDNIEDALRILATLVKYPIITLGAKGSATIVDNQVYYIHPRKEFTCVDTTGAGDNFLAGIMYGLYHDWDILKAMTVGNICGGHSTTQIGCCKASLNLAQLKNYLQNTPN